MNKKTSTIISLIFGFFTIISSSCENPDRTSRYTGFEKVIKEKEISLISSTSTAKPLTTVKIPALNESHFDFAKSIRNIRYIPLQKTPQSAITNIDRIFCAGDRIIIVDKKITESVLIFDSKGKFINRISAKNVYGKTQSNDLTHFYKASFYPSKKQIVLYDDKKDKFYYFNDKGVYINEERAFLGFSDFENFFGTDNFVYLSLYNYNKHIPILRTSDIYLGSSGTRISGIAQNSRQKIRIKNKYYYDFNLAQSGKQVFYTPVFSDTVYEINSTIDGVFPKFKIEFPGEIITNQVRSNQKMDINKLVKLKNSNKYYFFEGKVFSASDDIYYFECQKNGILGYFYSMKTNKIFGGEIRSSSNRTDSLIIDAYTYPIASTGEEFISVLDPSTYHNIPNSIRTKAYSNAINGINSKSNPILVFYKINSF